VAFLDSSTAVIDAILTKKGRELLSRNDGSFQITKFAFGDDEINYQLFDISNTTNPEQDILNLPVLEPISNEEVALLNRLISLPKGSLRIGVLTVQPTSSVVLFGNSTSFSVATENSTDSTYTATVRDENIAVLQNPTANTDANGNAIFTLLTGETAGGLVGSTVVDIVGTNSGARNTFNITVQAN